mmetsp:Transcript_12834/g.14740  ORF Transcript_12834/g.14740 Transcript_12834/m.14740 type:complete len:156 (+) Transcript_12834:166-633(+)
MKRAAGCILPRSSIFLFNITDRLLSGIFEALTLATQNVNPTALSKKLKATTSPFPIQIRVQVSLECPPLEDVSILNSILRSWVAGRIGPLTHAQSAAVASLLASQCGALLSMKEYEDMRNKGDVSVQAPPIALPPRKIGGSVGVSSAAVCTVVPS